MLRLLKRGSRRDEAMDVLLPTGLGPIYDHGQLASPAAVRRTRAVHELLSKAMLIVVLLVVGFVALQFLPMFGQAVSKVLVPRVPVPHASPASTK